MNPRIALTLVIALVMWQPFWPNSAAQAQQAARPPGQSPELRAAIAKTNAYIGLFNRTQRAVQSWERYASWVNMRTGPTGRERYITYGLYSLYDVRDEIRKATEAASQQPTAPELDATVRRYIAAYEALAPLITQAERYYDSKEYRDDNVAKGKQLHTLMVPAAEAFLREHRLFNQQVSAFKSGVDQQELAALEASEGKRARWHVRNVMIEARKVVDLLPTNETPVINVKTFEDAVSAYAAAVRAFDEYTQANPGAVSAFESRPRGLLGKLRDFRDKIARAKGDARRGAGQDLTWIVNDYNMMISMSEVSLRTLRQ